MSWSRCGGRLTVHPQLTVFTTTERYQAYALNPASLFSGSCTLRHHPSSRVPPGATRPSCPESDGRSRHASGFGSRWTSFIRSSLATKSPLHGAHYDCSSRCCFSTSAEIGPIRGPTFMELFGGIGGFGLGASERGLICVYTNENDRHSAKTYEINHCGRVPGISKVDTRKFEQVVEDAIKQVVEQDTCTGSLLSSPPPRATVLFAGFPCQPFSNAGNRQGLDCKKNGHHLYEILKLLIYQRNPIVVLENVKSFAENKDFGAMAVAVKEFEELGYHVSHHVYKAVDFNLPQNRERLFIVAVRKDLATTRFKFQEPPSRRSRLALTDFLDPPDRLWDRGQYGLQNGFIPNPYVSGSACDKLPKEVWTPTTRNGKEAKFVSEPSTPGRGKGLLRLGYLRIEGQAGYNSNDVVYHHTGLAGTITTEMRNWYQVPHTGGREIIRRLSLREGLRIQGFPEDFMLSAKKRPRQIGNAVAPPISEWIVRCLQDQYPNIFSSDACSTTEVWPYVPAPKTSSEERQRIMQHLDRLEARRKDGQEQRRAQRALREEAKRTASTRTDEYELSAALESKLRLE